MNPRMLNLPPDPDARETALDALRLYLGRRTQFSDLELLKLWKSLFFSMWMCDKPIKQQQLARDLAGLVTRDTSAVNVMPFVGAFWSSMSREWSGIDVYRCVSMPVMARHLMETMTNSFEPL